MADEKGKTWYGEIEETITDTIKENRKRDITAVKLQGVLLDIVDLLKGKWLFGGVVQPSSQVDITGDVPTFYIAFTKGTYTNFGNNEVADGEFALFMPNLNGNWDVHKWSIGALLDGKVNVKEGYDLSKNDYTDEDRDKVASLPDNVAGKSGDTFPEDNFASFDENGNVVDSGCNEGSFAPMSQAVPSPDPTQDNGKILGYEAPMKDADPVVGWVEKPHDGLTPEIDTDTKKWKIGDNITDTYAEGKSALQIYNDLHPEDTPLTEPQFIEMLKATYPMKYVGYDINADSANVGAELNTLDGNAAGSTYEHGLYLMPNADPEGQTAPTGSVLFICVNVSEDTYKWVKMGDVNIPTNVVTDDRIDDTHLKNPVGDDETNAPTLAKAEDVMQLKAKLEGVTASETKVQLVESGDGQQNVYNGYINGSTGKYSQSNYNKFIVVPLNGARSVRWLAKENASNPSYLGWAFGTFGGEIDSTLSTFTALSKGVYANNPLDNQAVEYVKDAPEGATHAVITIWIYRSGGGSAVTMNNFYCYLQSGESVSEMIKSLEDNIAGINHAFSIEVTPSVVSTITGQFYSGSVGSAISTSDSTNMRGTQFAVTPGKEYHLVDILTSAYTNLYLVRYTDANNIVLSRYYFTSSTNYSFDAISKAPDNAAYAYVNYLSTYASTFSFKELQTNFVNVNNINETTNENATAIGTINEQIETINDDIEEIQDSFKYEEGRVDAEYDSTISGSFWKGSVGTEISTKSSAITARGRRYIVTGGNTYHLTLTLTSQYYGFYMIRWCDENNIVVKVQENITNTGSSHIFDKDYVAPDNAAYFYLNYASNNTPTFQEIIYGTANVGQMASDIEDLKEITSDYSKKLMKVVVRSMTGYGWTNAYYIRTKYNDTQDIIIQNQINSNTLLSFYAAYVGPNTLEDSQLRTSTYLVCDCDDSTAPFFGSTLYWHLYGQHGVPIPVINNNVNMTSASVGTLWQDTITYGGEPFVRQYRIGYVDSSKIYLLPVFYEDSDGRMTRGWKNEANSTAITLLEFVDAGTGTDEGITQINVTGYGQVQKRPIIENSNRHFYADNIEITEPGTYYCDELKVSESQVGYDPATITDTNYFSGSSNRVNLEGALPLVEFTWSYLYKGATCAMNTTVKMLREFRCQSYGAIQQQYFHNLNYDNKTYTAKFLIPKCKLNSMNVPFTEPSAARQYYRISSNLVNVNDPVDRQIGWLENTSGTNDFRVGLAAGLSLVTGDTVKEKRIQNIPEGDRPAGATSESSFWRLGSISPSNTNKFYIAAINTAPYQDNNYNFPVGMFKEINCYVSYFDPSQNFGQVYWYKDGNSYLIYCHAQSASQNQVINVPEYMEGLNLSIVEKTDNAELLTSTITNGKFYVNYTGTDQVKYIVLKAN